MASLISKASLLMVPSTYEDGTLYNVLPSGNKAPDETGSHNGYDQTRADFTFSRGSNLAATRVNSDGLIEKGRENLLVNSNAFSSSGWTTSNASVTSGQADKDDGTNAWKLTASGTFAFVRQLGLSVNGVTTASVYLKAGTTDWVNFRLSASANNQIYVNIANGTFGTISASHLIDKSIENVGDGWFRVNLVLNTTSLTGFYIYVADGDNTLNTSNETIYFQSAQLEKSMVATDYIETGSSTAQAGILEDMPRINYDANGKNGALLLESSRTNSAPISELFDQAYSTYYNFNLSPVVTTNYGTSPEGLSNSSRLDTTAANSGWYTDGQSVSSGATYTCSIFAKLVSGSESNVVRFGFSLNGDKLSRYDLSNGTINYDHPDVTTSIQDYGNGWYRLIQTITTTSSGTLREVLYSYNDAGDYEIYGHQVEAGSHVSSYVPTYGSAATRGADSCLDAGSAESINSTEGVFYAEINTFASDGTKRLSLSDGSSNNRVVIGYTSAGQLETFVVAQGTNVFYSPLVTDIKQTHKIAVRYKSADYSFYVDGTEINTSSSSSVPTGLNQCDLKSAAGNFPLFGNVKQVAVFDEALSDSELADLTS